MQAVIWGGAALTLLGVAGLAYCVWRTLKARKAGLPDAELRIELQQVVTINLGALAISALGLMVVVLGIFLA